jgi:hypothetical protein
MRVLTLILCVLIMSTFAYAGEFFTSSETKDLRIVELNRDNGYAVLKDPNGNEAEVNIGDTVGIDRGTVTKIGKASITVRVNNTNTKIPARHGFGKSAGS